MRAICLALVSLAALAACSPGGGASSSAPAGSSSAAAGGTAFPDAATAAYKLEGTMTVGGQTIPQTRYQDGAKMRMDMNGPMGATSMVVNNDTHEGFTIAHVAGRTIASRIDLTQQGAGMSHDRLTQLREEMKGRAHRIGACSAAGETGSEWDMGAATGADTTTSTTTDSRSLCLTSDGILLQMKLNGQVMFNTTSIQRGPQDPALFEAPAGVHFTTMQVPSQARLNDMIARARAAAAAHNTPNP